MAASEDNNEERILCPKCGTPNPRRWRDRAEGHQRCRHCGKKLRQKVTEDRPLVRGED